MHTDTYIAQLSEEMLMTLAEHAAAQIKDILVTRHLHRVGHVVAESTLHMQRETLASLRRFVRSLRHAERIFPPHSPRRLFRNFLKAYLNAQFERLHLERRWQDYVARVASQHSVPCPAPGSPEWTTFILRSRRAA